MQRNEAPLINLTDGTTENNFTVLQAHSLQQIQQAFMIACQPQTLTNAPDFFLGQQILIPATNGNSHITPAGQLPAASNNGTVQQMMTLNGPIHLAYPPPQLFQTQLQSSTLSGGAPSTAGDQQFFGGKSQMTATALPQALGASQQPIFTAPSYPLITSIAPAGTTIPNYPVGCQFIQLANGRTAAIAPQFTTHQNQPLIYLAAQAAPAGPMVCSSRATGSAFSTTHNETTASVLMFQTNQEPTVPNLVANNACQGAPQPIASHPNGCANIVVPCQVVPTPKISDNVKPFAPNRGMPPLPEKAIANKAEETKALIRETSTQSSQLAMNLRPQQNAVITDCNPSAFQLLPRPTGVQLVRIVNSTVVAPTGKVQLQQPTQIVLQRNVHEIAVQPQMLHALHDQNRELNVAQQPEDRFTQQSTNEAASIGNSASSDVGGRDEGPTFQRLKDPAQKNPTTTATAVSPGNSTVTSSCAFQSESSTVQVDPNESTPSDESVEVDESENKQKRSVSSTKAAIVNGIDLEEIRDFASAFKMWRKTMGLSQIQAAHSLYDFFGPSFSQKSISRFENLDVTPGVAIRMKADLERFMAETAKARSSSSAKVESLDPAIVSNKRKRKPRTCFPEATITALDNFFKGNTHPNAHQFRDFAANHGLDKESVRVWFYNKRRTLKRKIENTESIVRRVL